MSGFTSQIIHLGEARLVFPLIRELVPGLGLKDWMQFARYATNPRRAEENGIVAVTRHGRAMPCGLFLYRRERQLSGKAVLVAEHFVALDVLDAQPVLDALVEELDALARRLSCDATRVLVPGEASLLRAGLQAAGHATTGVTLGKAVPHEAVCAAVPETSSRH
jgi:hypothetical protein